MIKRNREAKLMNLTFQKPDFAGFNDFDKNLWVDI